MSAAHFSIGIDLGTTNSALAYAPLNGDAAPEALPIQQWETPETLAAHCQINLFLQKEPQGRILDHAAATAFRHSFAASTRKIRSVERETRWG